jgi:isopentenyldiphosphate isomerase
MRRLPGGDVDEIDRAREAAAEAGAVVGPAVYAAILDLYQVALDSKDVLVLLQKLAPEYGRAERLLCVTEKGGAASLDGATYRRLVADLERSADLAGWIRPGERPGSGVWVARWLCHLIGLRHRTVQLFIDHPRHRGYTLAQVRSTAKELFPGCVDVPAAGHIAGVEDTEEALFAELYQELGLRAADLHAVQAIGSYGCAAREQGSALIDVEFRSVYAGRLTERGLVGARFVDGEVAAVAVFSLAELQSLVERFPQRVASGLLYSLPLYLAYRASCDPAG